MEHEYLDIENGVVKGFKQGAGRDTVEIPDGVPEIGEATFARCTSLTNVSISGNIQKIDDWTFAFCTSLQCITIPQSVQSISRKAFLGCHNFVVHYAGTKEQWCIIKGVADNQDLLYHAHVHCSNGMIKVELVNDLIVYGSVLVERFLCGLSKIIQIPQNITRINSLAFYGCHCRMTIKIPNSVTEIGKDAFGDCPNFMIHYDGTMADWAKIGGNKCGLTQGLTVQCADDNITI